MTIFDVCCLIVNIKMGIPFDGKTFHILKDIYNTTCPYVVLKCSRQVGKSYTLCLKSVLRATLQPGYSSLTLFPENKHMYKFSRLVVDPIVNNSEPLRDMINSKCVWTVTLKQFINSSELHYNFLGDDPLRVRGITAKDTFTDEVQSILADNLYVAEQCSSRYTNANFWYSGTPLSVNNFLEKKWRKSSQNTVCLTCSKCNFDNFCILPDVYKMITPKGLVCQKCGKKISQEDLYNVKLICQNPAKKSIFEGYHLTQLFMPDVFNPTKWSRIFKDYEDYRPYAFANEVLGLSYDTGGRPITQEKLRSLCVEKFKYDFRNYAKIVLGVDWGGDNAAHSKTVVCVLGLRVTGKYDVIYMQKFSDPDRPTQMKEILKIYHHYKASAIGVDYGLGLTDNQILRRYLPPYTVFEYQYLNPKKLLQFNPQKGRYMVNRSETINLLFTDLNSAKINFPCYNESESFFEDILSIFEEIKFGAYGERKYYNHDIEIPDDFFHALNFAVLTIKILTKDSILDTIINDDILGVE